MNNPENQPAFYFPLASGRYDVKPGLFTLGTDFGNGIQDGQLFQFDKTFNEYRGNKLKGRKEKIDKYFCQTSPLGNDPGIIQFIIQHLCDEHPSYFVFKETSNTFCCSLTGECISFANDFSLVRPTKPKTQVTYLNSLDALAMQVQEDMAIVEIDTDGNDRITNLHLFSPNHWAAEDKIGKGFIDTHAPVPGMAKINKRARELNLACLEKGPFVRFAWGLSTDKRLNHHPLHPTGFSPREWQGRAFSPDCPQLYLRVERQVINGFPGQRQLLFTIRTYFYDVAELEKNQLVNLISAINSMPEEVLVYKGIRNSKTKINDWLNRLI